MSKSDLPFEERGGALRGALDAVSGRFPAFVFGGGGDGLLPVFHFHDVTSADLEPKLRYLVENNYRTVRSDEIDAYVGGRSTLAPSSVALCFDDAWASLWTVAAPLLRRYGLSAITYAIPARMDDAAATRPTIDQGAADSTPAGSRFVTWPELAALSSSGIVDVQCHTDTHSMVFCSPQVSGFVEPDYGETPLLNRPQLSPLPHLRFVTSDELGAPLYRARSRMSSATRVAVPERAHERCIAHVASHGGRDFFRRPGWREELGGVAAQEQVSAPAETDSARATAIEAELDRGRAVLNQRLKTTSVNHICLPWGVSSELTAATLARLGYRTAFANRLAGVHAVKPGDDRYWLKRLPNRYIPFLPGRGRRYWFLPRRRPSAQ